MICPANTSHLLITSCLVLVLAGSVSCSTYQNLVVYQSDASLIALGELPAGYPSLGPNHHPYTISPKKLLTLLAPLEYREGSLLPFSWGYPRKVFTADQSKMLAQELSKAFDMALPQEVVAFTVADEEKPDRRTKGFTFIMGDELHLILEELRKPSYLGEQKTYQLQAHRWELIPGNSQRLYAASPEEKGTVPHWVICPLKP
jgi:hypothetical protein